MTIYNPEIVSRWIVALIFLVGGVINIIGIKPVRDEFSRWGLRPWMRIGTGISELLLAFALLTNVYVIQSLIASALIMLSAMIIIAYNKEMSRIWVPGSVLFFIVLSLSFHF
ncbi:DoxX family protein [Klebsiella pneumoniae]